MVDLRFPVRGDRLSADHAHTLYAALSHRVPAFHDPEARVRFAPVNGLGVGGGEIQLTERSRLIVRLPDDSIRLALPLAGRTLEVGSYCIGLGMPVVAPLHPAPSLAARVVTFKNSTEAGPFLEHCREELKRKGIGGEPAIPLLTQGARAGEPRRKVVRIHGKRVIGYALLIEGLTAEESIRLQEEGLGGRTRMGCGFFLPTGKGEA